MKKAVLLGISLFVMAGSALAQGSLEFGNWVSPFGTGLNSPVYVDTVPSGPHPNTTGGVLAPDATVVTLYWGAAGASTIGQLTATAITSTLNSFPGNGGYFNGGIVAIPGTTAGSTISVAIKAENTTIGKSGFSNIIQVSGLGAGATDPLAPKLNGLQPWAIVVPEPSTILLGLLGGAGLLFRRRK
jgi:hypothetical protein